MKTTESNKAFSADRFLALIKSDMTVNKGNYIKHTFATLGVFAALAILISINASIDISSLRHNAELTGRILDSMIASHQGNYGTMYIIIAMWLTGIGLTVFGSLTFSNLSTKRQRIAALMVPASQSEKFLLRVLIYFVGGTVLLIAGALFGLTICQIAFGGGWESLKAIFEDIDNGFEGCITAGVILMALFWNSLYALGSSLWPRLSWIKTWVALLIVQWVAVAIFMVLAAADINWEAFAILLMNIDKTNVWVLI